MSRISKIIGFTLLIVLVISVSPMWEIITKGYAENNSVLFPIGIIVILGCILAEWINGL